MYEEAEGQTSSYRDRYLIVNTRDPTLFENLYKEATTRLMKQAEKEIELALDTITKDSKSAIKG